MEESPKEFSGVKIQTDLGHTGALFMFGKTA
jgi:hypothetical protein